MKNETEAKAVSQGVCAFCNTEVIKSKMTQHLKFCKTRLATIAKQEAASQQEKTQLFHILAEGRYNPQYWLHFEVPATDGLWSLDSFLKKMWIDDLGHLSDFTINGTNYSAEDTDRFAFFGEAEESEGEEEDEGEELSDEEEEKVLGTIIDEVVSDGIKRADFYNDTGIKQSAARDLKVATCIEEIKKPRTLYVLINFLKEELKRIHKEERDIWKDDNFAKKEFRQMLFSVNTRRSITGSLLDAIEDRSMDVLLKLVLKVGQKFSYTYDFGSSTHINLKVIAEREGIVQNEGEPVQLLARNTAPTFSCKICGKPATQVELGYFSSSIEGYTYCKKCAKKEIEEGQEMRIINSPRVGVL